MNSYYRLFIIGASVGLLLVMMGYSIYDPVTGISLKSMMISAGWCLLLMFIDDKE